ncbi:hypothetical protein [uncultured Reyranella sp.]|uniref:hypothetical protein n=1 Tax=uncultured Reyranella sp. TaxID=735512 RepID=UPI0025FEA98F|nr:hypothetical protein [uncultured Reyranella sp.]
MAEETRIIRLVIDSSKAVEGGRAAQRALEQIERSTSSLDGAMARMEQSLGRIGGYMKAQLALMAAELAARFVQIGKEAFDAASGMGELADQLGVTTRGLQALQYSAVQNGVKLEQLETGVSKFSQRIGEAAGGSREMIEALNGMGVKVLDLNGKLRPTETLMSEVAASILAIDDPAKRSAASVDFFGKAGTRFLPVLQDMAKGLDAMGAAADRGGAMISERAIVRLDQLGDAVARSGLKMRATFANTFVDLLDEIEARLAKVNIGFSEADWAKGAAYNKQKLDELAAFLGRVEEESAVSVARFIAGFEKAISTIPELLGKAFVDGMNNALGALESGLSRITGTLERNAPWLGVKSGDISLGRLSGGGASLSDRNSQIQAAENQAEAGIRTYYAANREQRDRAALIARQAGYAGDEDAARRGTPGAVVADGKSNPAVKGAGDAVADRIGKALADSARELEQARAFAEVANQGAEALARLEAHFKALKTAQDVFGKTANDNARGVADLTEKLEEQAVVTLKLKNLGDFHASTETLRDQNELLEAELRLANQLPEVRAREIAVLKTMQEVKAKGLEGEIEAIEQRRQAIEQNERLKSQGEELKRANELWTEPLKTALNSIQSTAADAFATMLESGKLSFQALGDVVKKTVFRMIAEFAALATIRPLMGALIGGLTGIGLVSPSMAASMGYGAGGSTVPSISMPSPGGNSLSLPGGNGLGGMFGGSTGFFSQPIASLFPSSAPAGGYADVGALLASGNTGATASAAGIGGLGGISIGSALGAIGGIGMGAYQLFNSKSTGQTLGGIGSMIGAGVSLIPGVGQIAGPLIMMASALLPSLFGESNTRTHSSTNASLHYGDGNWYTTGGAWGPNANSSQSESALRGLTGGIDQVFGLLGGVKDASKVWGLNASSWTAQGKDWSYTSNATHLVDPSGNQEAWRMNMDDMMDTGAAQVAIRSILSGAVGEISATMKTALEHMRAAAMGIKETAESIVFVDEVYERLGKGALTVRMQFRELEKQFGDMTDKATRLGLALAPIEAEQKKATERLGQDYVDNLIDPIAASLRAWEDEKQSILANIDYIRQHTDVIVDQARIAEALLRREAALKDQLYGGAISQLEDAIRRLSLGDLANLSPTTMLTGVQAAYQATVAQARSGDSSAIARVAAEGTSFAQAAQSYYASGPDYEALKQQILDDLLTLQSQIAGGGSTTGSALNDNNGATRAAVAQVAELQSVVSEQSRQIATLMAKLSETNDLLLRRAVNG